MTVVARASASRGAASRGVTIPGNAVVEVFRNDYAVRMLNESVAAGYEAPLRFYPVEAGQRIGCRLSDSVRRNCAVPERGAGRNGWRARCDLRKDHENERRVTGE